MGPACVGSLTEWIRDESIAGSCEGWPAAMCLTGFMHGSEEMVGGHDPTVQGGKSVTTPTTSGIGGSTVTCIGELERLELWNKGNGRDPVITEPTAAKPRTRGSMVTMRAMGSMEEMRTMGSMVAMRTVESVVEIRTMESMAEYLQ